MRTVEGLFGETWKLRTATDWKWLVTITSNCGALFTTVFPPCCISEVAFFLSVSKHDPHASYLLLYNQPLQSSVSKTSYFFCSQIHNLSKVCWERFIFSTEYQLKLKAPSPKWLILVLSRFGPGLCAEGSSPGLSLYGLLGLLYGLVEEFQQQASHRQKLYHHLWLSISSHVMSIPPLLQIFPTSRGRHIYPTFWWEECLSHIVEEPRGQKKLLQ